MQSISTRQFREISQDNQKKIIIFSAPWCSPCRMFKPVLDKISTDLDIPCYTINIDEEDSLAQELNIRSVPTTFIYDMESPEPTIILGMKSEADVKSILA